MSGKVSRAEVSAERKVSAERESEPSGRLSLLLCFPNRGLDVWQFVDCALMPYSTAASAAGTKISQLGFVVLRSTAHIFSLPVFVVELHQY